METIAGIARRTPHLVLRPRDRARDLYGQPERTRRQDQFRPRQASSGNRTTLDAPDLLAVLFLSPDEVRDRYTYPMVRVDSSRWPILQTSLGDGSTKSIATQTVSGPLTLKRHKPTNAAPVSKPSPRTNSIPGLPARSRFHVSENNLYAYLFESKQPFVHTMGYFVSVASSEDCEFRGETRCPPSADAPILPRRTAR